MLPQLFNSAHDQSKVAYHGRQATRSHQMYTMHAAAAISSRTGITSRDLLLLILAYASDPLQIHRREQLMRDINNFYFFYFQGFSLNTVLSCIHPDSFILAPDEESPQYVKILLPKRIPAPIALGYFRAKEGRSKHSRNYIQTADLYMGATTKETRIIYIDNDWGWEHNSHYTITTDMNKCFAL